MARRRRRRFVGPSNVVPTKTALPRRLGRPNLPVLRLRPASEPIYPSSRSAPVRYRSARVAKKPVRSQKAAGFDAFGPVQSIGGPIVRELNRALSCADRKRRREVLFALDLRRKGKGGSRKPKSTEKC